MKSFQIIAVLVLVLAVFYFGCKPNKETEEPKVYNMVKVENGLKFIFPNFSKIDLVCDSMPSKCDSAVIFTAEAAYTGGLLEKFHHTNIAGDHVCSGVKHRGYRCSRNTGAFVYYKGSWKFCNRPYENEIDSAVVYGGAAFGQELIIKDSILLNPPRKDRSKNIFRALCEVSGRLCIIESVTIIEFGEFKSRLIEAKVKDAIYLDMGGGWNHAWYRHSKDSIVELHPKRHNYCTNWITFYE